MPGYDFAATVEEVEPYVITLSYKRDENGALVKDDEGNPIPDDKVVLPPVLPADLMLRFLDMDRKEIEAMANRPADQIKVGARVIEELIGKEKWEHVIRTIGFTNMKDLMMDVFAYYGLGGGDEGEDSEASEEGKGEEGNESPSTQSSTISELSTPTSSDTTPTPGEDSTEENSIGRSSFPESPISLANRSL